MTTRVVRFYRALLHLYPRGFRSEYEQELTDTFVERAREYSGPFSSSRALLAAVADVVPNAIAVHGEILRQDLRYAARSLRRTPGFALTAVLVIALGIGANTAAFSLADFVLLRPLSFPQPERLVRMWQTTPGYGQMELSPANYRDWKAMATSSFERIAAFETRTMNLVGSGEPRRLELAGGTPGFFQVLGVPALAGRVFAPDDSLDKDVVVLSNALWLTQFGGDPGVIGKVLRIDDTQYTVIGVMPSSFRFPSREIDAWFPRLLTEQDFTDRGDNYLDVVARLRDGVTIDRANAEITRVTAELSRLYPRENEKTGGAVYALSQQMSQRARLLVLALCGATFCILLLACANLASLLIARAAHRSRELAVRAALGAGRDRLVRQLVTESLALAVVGGVLGIAIAFAGLPLLSVLVPTTLPIADRPTIDPRVLLVAATLVIVTGIGFGVGPAVGAGRSKGLEALREGTRSAGRTQRTRMMLVLVEVAASVVLLVSSGLLIRAVLRIQATDPGFRAENVLTLRTDLGMSKYTAAAYRTPFYERVLGEVRALPGVQSAAYMSGLPMIMRGGIFGATIAGEAVVRDGSNTASLRFVTPQFFASMGIPLQSGRDVAESDTRENLRVAVVSESFAKRLWPNDSPIGKSFNFAFEGRTVVGVVGDVRVRGLERESEPQVYIPARQLPDSTLAGYIPKDLVIRTTAPTAVILPAVRRIITSADPEQPISSVRTLTEVVANETASRVTQLRLLGILSAIALLIAGVGIHGLLAFAVSRRAREIGVRRALGEPAGSIVRRVLREGLGLATAGVVIGVFVAYLAARGMGALLAGVQPGDPMTIASAALLCFVTAIVGCVRPAVRAARVDPIAALRGD